MMKYSRFHPSGFTLIEMMIVISIIIFLVSLAFFPYAYYMKRSYVERSIDILGQEWILSHKDVRNGKLFSDDRHANIVLIFGKGVNGVAQYLLSGSSLPPLMDFRVNTTNTDIKFQKLSSFDSDIEVLGFRGFLGAENEGTLGYMIAAPSGSGYFFTGSQTPFSSTGIFLTIGYTGARLETGHAREILLRPYLQ